MATASVSAGLQHYCAKCSKPDIGSDTITCVKCRRWYHGRCVSGGGDGTDGSWTCTTCTVATIEPARSTSSASSSRSVRIKLQLMRLEEEKEAMDKRLRERQEQERHRDERAQKEKEELDNRYFDNKYALLMADAIEEDEEVIEEEENQQNFISKVDDWIISSSDSLDRKLQDDDVLSLARSDSFGSIGLSHPSTSLSALGDKVIFSYDAQQIPFRMGHLLFTSTPVGGIVMDQPAFNNRRWPVRLAKPRQRRSRKQVHLRSHLRLSSSRRCPV